ncbi:MAG: hypothetical protein OIF35_04460, partial [Cellvibrionaceae bacterium]|nr:hypothetical protein [Cellvibrionaceae bacterium]
MKLPKLSIKPLLSLALCCGLMGAQPALSQSMELKAVPESIQQSITAGLRKAIPEFEIEYISRTPADGLYSVQVLMGPKIFVNGAGDFLINDQGHSI